MVWRCRQREEQSPRVRNTVSGEFERKTEDLTFKVVCSVSDCVWTNRRGGGDIGHHFITPPVQMLCCSISTQFDFIQEITLRTKISSWRTWGPGITDCGWVTQLQKLNGSKAKASQSGTGQQSSQLNPQRPLWAHRRARTCCRMRLVVLKRSRCSSIKRLETSQISWSGKPWMG